MLKALIFLAAFPVALLSPAPATGGGGGGGAVTFAHVQSCGAQNAGGVSAATVTCGSAITAGDVLWVCVSNASGSALSFAWTGDSGTFTGAPSGTNVSYNNNGNTWKYSCYYVLSAGGGGTTLTGTSANLFYPGITVDEFSITGGTAALDTSATPASGSGTTPTSGSLTTTAANELVLGFFPSADAVSALSPSLNGASSAFPSRQTYQMPASAGAITATGTSVSTTWGAYALAIN